MLRRTGRQPPLPNTCWQDLTRWAQVLPQFIGLIFEHGVCVLCRGIVINTRADPKTSFPGTDEQTRQVHTPAARDTGYTCETETVSSNRLVHVYSHPLARVYF